MRRFAWFCAAVVGQVGGLRSWRRFAGDNVMTGVLVTLDQDFILPKSKIISRAVQKLSLMPLGLTDNLSQNEFNDLVAYLRSLQ